MYRTAMYAHLERQTDFAVGTVLRRGDWIAKMGNTGTSFGAHLHLGCVHEKQTRVWRLSDMEKNIIVPDPVQLNYFIDGELFGVPLKITTFYCDPRYRKGLIHMAYDVIPKSGDPKHFNIYWNRTPDGIVVAKGVDKGYGYFILIGFET